jgi:hypothetical protein
MRESDGRFALGGGSPVLASPEVERRVAAHGLERAAVMMVVEHRLGSEYGVRVLVRSYATLP